MLISVSGSAGTQQQQQLVQTWGKAHFVKSMHNVNICHHDHFVLGPFKNGSDGLRKSQATQTGSKCGGQENGEEDWIKKG